ncbi:MAG: HAD family hydrolase [Treponemataceae bacterium]
MNSSTTSDKSHPLLADTKIVLFDFDGVIVDSSLDIISAVNETLSNFGYRPIANEKIISFVGDGARKLIFRSLQCSMEHLQHKQDLPVDKLEDMYLWYVDYYAAHAVEQSLIYEGIPELIETLFVLGMRSGIVSNKPFAITNNILDYFDLSDFFDTVICAEQVKKMKPDPEGINLAVTTIYEANKAFLQNPILPENVLMIGDTATDIKAGHNFGCKTCAFMSGLGNKEKLCAENADISIDEIKQLLHYL